MFPNISQSKSNQIMKFGQLMEYFISSSSYDPIYDIWPLLKTPNWKAPGKDGVQGF